MNKRIWLGFLMLVVLTLACGLPVGGDDPNKLGWPPKDEELPIVYSGIGSQIHMFEGGETCSVAANGTVTINADKTCSAEFNFEITNINTEGKCETSAELGIQNVLVSGYVSETFDVCNFSRYPASDQIFVDPDSKADIGTGWAKLNVTLLDGQKEPIHQITIDEMNRTK
jgi:hypothetical protein